MMLVVEILAVAGPLLTLVNTSFILQVRREGRTDRARLTNLLSATPGDAPSSPPTLSVVPKPAEPKQHPVSRPRQVGLSAR